MNKIAVLLLAISVASCLALPNPASAAVAENSWVTKAEMPTPRGYVGAVVVDGKIYAIGGSGPIGVNEEYDPALNTWNIKSSMPTPQQSFAIVAYESRIYCIGGLSGPGESNLNQVYDPATDTWQNKTSMPTGRYGAQAQVVGGKIYVTGGVKLLGYNQGVEQLNVTEAYDPSTGTWTSKASMPDSEGYVSAVIDDKIYVIGSGATQIYDPQTDTWSKGAAPDIGISEGANGVYAVAAATTGVMAPKRIYVYDGTILQVYNPYNDSWTNGTAPPTNHRGYIGIANVDDLLYFIGGFQFTENWRFIDYATNEQYVPFGYGNPTEPTFQQQEGIPVLLVGVLGLVTVLVIGLIVMRFRKRLNVLRPNLL